MRSITESINRLLGRVWEKLGFGMRGKLITIFVVVKVIPLLLLTAIAWREFVHLGNLLTQIAVEDSSAALNDSAVENIERMTTDKAQQVADFLYARDSDILYAAMLPPTEEAYRNFLSSQTGRVITGGEWQLAADGKSWVRQDKPALPVDSGTSSNSENNDRDGFHYRSPDQFTYKDIPLYDEITFVDLAGREQVKIVAENSPKTHYPLNRQKRDISQKENTYVKAETYFAQLQELQPGQIYVSDVIGAYVGSNYIGMYVPDNVAAAAETRGYEIPYQPEEQAYAGEENPNGQRFEGIIRWATPVTDENGEISGYVTLALNHDHIMEFVDHLTPLAERYTELPSAFEGNYAFIWDYNCRSICHPRHHSIIGFDPATGDPAVPWLESSIYEAWQASGIPKWTDFIPDWPTFDDQSRSKTPSPALTKAGLVGLDGRYLNNAPQCTGWMDLSRDGGSGSFYILWSGLYKLTTAAAIPYYTGQYAPGPQNGFSLRGFGIVTIGAGLEDFTQPSRAIGEKLTGTISDNLMRTTMQLALTTAILIVLVVFVAIWMASFLSNSILALIKGISRFKAGERQFRFMSKSTDEFGTLANSFDDMADSIVGSVNSPLSITDMQERIIYMNDLALDVYQMTLDQVVGSQYSEISIYPPGTQYCPLTALAQGRETEPIYLSEEQRYMKGSANYFLAKDGQKIGYIIVSTDVSEMVQERMQIEEQRTLLDKIFSASPDLIWYMDGHGRYLTVNPRFAAIAGKSVEEFAGKTARETLPPDLVDDFVENDNKAMVSASAHYTEERIVFADGHEEMLDSVRTPIFDANGVLTGLLGFARNVTVRVAIESELRHTQMELEQAVRDANRANEHKGEFLARMSHEIRTPMNAIIGMTSIVLRKLDEHNDRPLEASAIKSQVKQIEVSSQHLLGLLNDILDISKIDAGKIDLTEEIVDLSKLANTVVSIIKPRCDEKKITFDACFETLSPATFLTDSLRLRQVLINLLGNAVKFTPEHGRVEFRIEKMGRQNGRTQLRFSVRDTGIGISEEGLDHIFQSFEQGGSNISRKYGGTGLGLAISRSIVQLFGGDITVNSREDEGSEFCFTIWLTETASGLTDNDDISDASGKFCGKRALLVDDVEINRTIVMAMLESTGMEIDEAEDGLAAVKKFAESAEGAYDIIIMDVHMPNMDGYEASVAIRALNRQDAPNIPIVALTANAFKEDIDRALQHGMNAHIAKPVEMDKLIELLFRFLAVKREM